MKPGGREEHVKRLVTLACVGMVPALAVILLVMGTKP